MRTKTYDTALSMHPSIVIHFLIELNKMDAIKRGELEEEGKQYSSSYHQQKHRDGVIYCNPFVTVRDCTWLTSQCTILFNYLSTNTLVMDCVAMHQQTAVCYTQLVIPM